MDRPEPVAAVTHHRILIADDHEMVRQGLAAILVRRGGFMIVGEAADGPAAIDAYQALAPDLLLLDLSLPTLSGVEVVTALRARDPQARILIVTTYETDEDVRRSLAAGASGYLLKDAPGDEIVRAVLTVLDGERYLPPAVRERAAAAAGRRTLTARERQIVERLALGDTNKEMSRALAIGEGTVKSHLKTLFSKLGVATRTEALAEAVRLGYVRATRR